MNMNFECTSLNTQYNPEIISAIAKENNNSSKSNVSSVYDSKSINLDAAVLSISSIGSARINAMMSKSIQLRASASNPEMSAADRLAVNNQLQKIRKEMDNLQNTSSASTTSTTGNTDKILSDIEAGADVDTDDSEVNIEDNMEHILSNAEDSIMTQNMNREQVMQLL